MQPSANKSEKNPDSVHKFYVRSCRIEKFVKLVPEMQTRRENTKQSIIIIMNYTNSLLSIGLNTMQLSMFTKFKIRRNH